MQSHSYVPTLYSLETANNSLSLEIVMKITFLLEDTKSQIFISVLDYSFSFLLQNPQNINQEFISLKIVITFNIYHSAIYVIYVAFEETSPDPYRRLHNGRWGVEILKSD